MEDVTFIIQSTLGDIIIPMTLLNSKMNNNVFIDNGRRNNHKLLCVNAATLTTDQMKALLDNILLLLMTKIPLSFKVNWDVKRLLKIDIFNLKWQMV